MDDYIAKPIKAEMLITKVKYWLHHNANEEILEKEVIADKIEEEPAHIIIDLDTYSKLQNLSGSEILDQIYKEFENESLEQIVDCKKYLGMSDIHNILNKLHTLKGVSGTLGAIELESLSRAIEGKLKFGYYPELGAELEQLSDAHTRFVEHYTFILNSNSR
jgi:HPt (histidine-containing phosphotransfer) domain-containing protein